MTTDSIKSFVNFLWTFGKLCGMCLCCMKGVQHMRMIEELFYGNICPCEKSLTRGSEYSQLLNLAVKNEEKFSALLSPQQKEMFEKLKDCMTDMNNLLEKEAFIDGFRLGVKLVAEAVYDMSGEIYDCDYYAFFAQCGVILAEIKRGWGV